VVVGLKSRDDIKNSFDRLRELKDGNGGKCQGVLLEEACPEGLDLVLGVRLDKQYGPVLLVGLGGIYTELFKLASCRLLPISRGEIQRMLAEVPGLQKLLDGYRKQPAYDESSLVAAIERIAGFVCRNQDRVELFEVNPLRVLPGHGGVQALDCVVKLK
jgi:acetyltransferase